MDKVEDFDIQNALLPTYYNGLKTRIQTNAITDYDNAILGMIKSAVVNLTVYRAISELGATFDENGFVTLDNTSGLKSGDSVIQATGEPLTRIAYSLKDSGNAYINKIKAYLELNKDNYPEYTSDSLYVSSAPAFVVNNTDQNYFLGF
jgi:hypothetical protein